MESIKQDVTRYATARLGVTFEAEPFDGDFICIWISVPGSVVIIYNSNIHRTVITFSRADLKEFVASGETVRVIWDTRGGVTEDA